MVDIVDCNIITLTEAVIKRLSFQGKYIDIQAHLFNKTVINICHNYIPNKYATFMDEDSSWLNDHIGFLIKKKHFRNILKMKKLMSTTLQASKAELIDTINLSKTKYFKSPF